MAMTPAIPHEGRTVARYTLASGQTPLEGGAVYLSSGELTVCGADPAAVLGFAAHDYPGALALDPYDGDMLVFVAKAGSTFWISGSTDPSDYSTVGGQYGAAHEATTEVTYLDLTEATALVFTVHDVDLTRKLYLVSIIGSVRQADAV